MQLQPTEIFTISRQLFDPNDVDTSYVRAVVRNALTDAILKTVTLTHKGDRRFTGQYRIPADVSGLGFFITVTTSVFIDEDFTTYNPNYGEEQNTYLVQVRPNGQGGGGGGVDIDYKKIQKIVDNSVDAGVEEVKEAMPVIPKTTKVNLLPVMEKIELVHKAVKNIKKPDPVDLTPVLQAVGAVESLIQYLPTEIPEPNMTPVEEAFSQVLETLKKFMTTIESLPDQHREKIEEGFAVVKQTLDEVKTKGFALRLDGGEEKEAKTTKVTDPYGPRIKSLIS